MKISKKTTYKIDDSKIVPDGKFKVYYTLYDDELGNTGYQLENLDGEMLDINALNGYQMMYLNDCFANYTRGANLESSKAIEVFTEDKAREIKETINERYELFKDLCFVKQEPVSNWRYMSFIDKYIDEFEKHFNMTMLSNQNEFDDYYKYKVLSEIVEIKASEPNSFGTVDAQIDNYLHKYKIKDNGQVIDNSMYNRLKDVNKRANLEKVKARYDEMLKKIPEEYKQKYTKILSMDDTKDLFTNFYNINKLEDIVENIEKFEKCPSKIKVLVHWSEASGYYNTFADGKDVPQVYSLEEMDKRVSRNYVNVKERDGGYDKCKFTLFLDHGDSMEALITDRIDVGDPHTDTFTGYIKQYCENNEDLKLLCDNDKYFSNKFSFLLENENERIKQARQWKEDVESAVEAEELEDLANTIMESIEDIKDNNYAGEDLYEGFRTVMDNMDAYDRGPVTYVNSIKMNMQNILDDFIENYESALDEVEEVEDEEER